MNTTRKHPQIFPTCLFLLLIFGIFSPLNAQESELVISNLHADRVTDTNARIKGDVNPSNADTTVKFEWGVEGQLGEDGNTYPNAIPISPNFADLSTPASVRTTLAELEPGTTYRFPIIAKNPAGITVSGSETFHTLSPPTAVITGTAALSTTKAQVTGLVDPKGSTVNVSIEFGIEFDNEDGTKGVVFNQSAVPMPSDVSGDSPVTVAATLTGLLQGSTYRVRIRAQGLGGMTLSDEEVLSLNILSGLEQAFPPPPPPANATVKVFFEGPDRAGWRFVGNRTWRSSGEILDNLAPGKREMEFIPIPGYVHPLRETVELLEGENKVLNKRYFETPTTGVGSLKVILKPDDINSSGAQWRFVQEDTNWMNSGITRTNLQAGSYQVTFNKIDGYERPPTIDFTIVAGEARVITITYPAEITRFGEAPALQDYTDVSTNKKLPYAYLGLVRSELAGSSGFVVKRRVVATAGHAVFDDGSLSFSKDVRWFFQRHKDTYEPTQQTPRGFYISDGYAKQREIDDNPGVGSPESHNLDFAALYFKEDAGRGGYAGYLASDSGDDNEFMISTADKILAGYPSYLTIANGIDPRAKIHATPAFNQAMTPAFRETWTTMAAHGLGGMSGGPLFVRHTNGAFYPAAIYLGGSGQTVVRAIDSDVVDLFNRAEISANGGDNNSSGGISHTSIASGNGQPGVLKVIIEPAAARNAGGGWLLSPETAFRGSEEEESGLSPAIYKLKPKEIPGFAPPVEQQVTVEGGTTTVFVYTYQPILTPLVVWRFSNFSTYDNTGSAADNSDFDKDGEKNIEEFTAGTDPKSAGDVFRIATATKSGGTFTATCAGKEGRKYTLMRSTSLDGTWTRLGSKGPLASDGTVTLSDTLAPPDNSFYRIEVSLP